MKTPIAARPAESQMTAGEKQVRWNNFCEKQVAFKAKYAAEAPADMSTQ